jgi:lysyl-tRNA synthetase class 2
MATERDDRLRHVQDLRALGVDPFGRRFDGPVGIGAILKDAAVAEGKTFTLCGRIVRHNNFGKATFVHVQDWTGKIQVYLKKDAIGEKAFEAWKHVGLGDIIGATGTLGKSRTGELTIFATGFTLLSKALLPLPEKFHGLTDPETRYRQRYLDMIANRDVLDVFLQRSRIVSGVRRRLDALGYVEVETPTMHTIPSGAHARPFVTHHNALNRDLFMRIALEIPLKKLMIGGLDRVYEIGRVFRNEGVDTRHNPEFTMLELYHAYGDLRTMMELVETLVSDLAKEIHGSTRLPFGEKTIDLTPPWPREDYVSLLRKHAGVGIDDADALRAKLREKHVDPAGLSRIDLIDGVFGEYAEPQLHERATFVCNQPLEMTPLCREHPERKGCADRFEALVAGMELANAYTELNDPVEQRRRLIDQAGGDEMAKTGRLDEDFLTAMEHGMPPAGGLGIGIDRLVMVLTNRQSIREVILFPLLREST